MKISCVVSIAALFFLTTPALCAEEPVATLDPVVVTATRQEEPVSSVPAHITIIICQGNQPIDRYHRAGSSSNPDRYSGQRHHGQPA